MGCLFAFGRLIARACFRFGAMLASTLIGGLSFLLATVIGPLWLGAMHEFVVWVLGITHDGKPVHSRWQVGNRTAYAVLSGLAWVVAFHVVRVLWHLAGWLVTWAVGRIAPAYASWLLLSLATALVFGVGAFVGAQVHRHERGGLGRW